jgi:hypothetical protein
VEGQAEEQKTTPVRKTHDDEFVDLKSLPIKSTVLITPEGDLKKHILEEGVGNCVYPEDIVYYKHETRFDNG